MVPRETTDEQQLSISGSPDPPVPAVSIAPALQLHVRISVSSETYQKNSSTPFWLALTLYNDMSLPITISKTTRLINLPTALLHGCIAFRDTSDGSVVRYGCPKTSRPYIPSSRSGIPKRWKADAKDLLTLPSHGSQTIYFELTKDVTDHGWRKELWHQGFDVGKQYEVVIPEDTSIMYWMSATSEEVLSVQGHLGPEWPQDHLNVQLTSEPKATFTVV